MRKLRKPLRHHVHDYFFPHERNKYRPHLFSAASVAVLAAAILLFEGAFLAQTKFVFLNTDFLASVLPAMLATLTNQDRAAYDLAEVTEDPLLDRAAQAAALDMAAKGYFSHVSPDGKTPWYWLDQVGYTYSYAGQNLAVNFTDSENVESAWMASPLHRANIVKREYTHVGFGTANGIYEERETTFVVEYFATPASHEATQGTAPVVASAPAETSSVKVLGTQTNESSAPAAPRPSPNWLVRLLASPLSTLVAILSIFFAAVASAFLITVLIRKKVTHPTVYAGGALLFALIGVAMLASFEFAGPVLLNAEPASVQAALP